MLGAYYVKQVLKELTGHREKGWTEASWSELVVCVWYFEDATELL